MSSDKFKNYKRHLHRHLEILGEYTEELCIEQTRLENILQSRILNKDYREDEELEDKLLRITSLLSMHGTSTNTLIREMLIMNDQIKGLIKNLEKSQEDGK